MAQRLSTSGAVGVVIENVPEVAKALQEIGTRAARRVARKALAAGLKPVTKTLRSNARTMIKKVTGVLRSSVGSRQRANKKKGVYEAVAGFNVGATNLGVRTTKTGKNVNTRLRAPHAAFLHGTKDRWTETVRTKENGHYRSFTKATGIFRGSVKPNRVVPTSYAQSAPECLRMMKQKLDIEIQVEVSKAYQKFGKDK